MSGKNKSFAADLAGAIDPVSDAPARPSRLGMGMLAGRNNRLAEVAGGGVTTRVHELVEPARCRMWAGHNREYEGLSEERCHDLIESLKAQGKQEVPAIVRRVRDHSEFDYEVICGARRHWSVSWLRTHNYPEFRFLVEVRELSDEEAFRLGDLENRAREDITDLERSRDYLRALPIYYDGHQATMAERLNVSTSWLSRYLDLARLPAELTRAFKSPHDLVIRHIVSLKPLLKPDDKRDRVFAAAASLDARRKAGDEAVPKAAMDVIRYLTMEAEAPKRTGAPKKTGKASTEVIHAPSGAAIIRVDKRDRKSVTLTVLHKGGATREEAEAAFKSLADQLWS
jgi:ParB family transcriptional regulator, chromosome partitioning protein